MPEAGNEPRQAFKTRFRSASSWAVVGMVVAEVISFTVQLSSWQAFGSQYHKGVCGKAGGDLDRLVAVSQLWEQSGSKTWFYLTASGRKAAPHRMEFVTRWPRTTTCSSRLAPLRPSSALQTSTSAFRFHNRIHPHIGPNGTFSAGAPAAVAAIVLAFLPCPTSRDVLIV